MIYKAIYFPEGITLATAGKYCADNIKVWPFLQEKTVELTDAQQEITPDGGYAGLSRVIVPAIAPELLMFESYTTVITDGTASIDVAVEDDVESVMIRLEGTWDNTSPCVYMALWNRGAAAYNMLRINGLPSATPRMSSSTVAPTEGLLSFAPISSTVTFLEGASYRIIKYKGATA